MIEFQDMGNWFRMKRLLETNKQTNRNDCREVLKLIRSDQIKIMRWKGIEPGGWVIDVMGLELEDGEPNPAEKRKTLINLGWKNQREIAI